MLTFIPLDLIWEMDTWSGDKLNGAKETLAFELTALIHGTEIAEKVHDTSKELFKSGGAADMPTLVLTEADFEDGTIDILTLLVKSGLCPTKGDARRNIDQGGVEADGIRVLSISKSFTKKECSGDGIVLRRGKKNFRRITVR